MALLVWAAAESWFLTDDAFISFRYARNLLEGHGLVFNIGERVEGYTNFLWTLELAALWGLFGLRPEHAAPWLSAACTAATVAAMLWWAARLPHLKQRKLTAWMALGLLCSSATFAALVSGHFLFRYAYYGELLPNTYYAKHVRPWYEMGFAYLWAAALETGLYLLLPLAWTGMRARLRQSRDGIYALPLLLIGAHVACVARIGGDRFGYRPLDFYWPLLALPAAAGLVHLASRLAAGARRLAAPLAAAGTRTWALLLFAPVLFYCSAVQSLLFCERIATGRRSFIEINEQNAGWLPAAPAMPTVAAVSNDLRRERFSHGVGMSFMYFVVSTDWHLRNWRPYEKMERGIIPDDAVTSAYSIGIFSYYLPDLTVIDRHGLTDAVIARNPVTTPNQDRVMAHDRTPPAGYLAQRGVNFTVFPAAADVNEAFQKGAEHALQIGPGLWMPFNSPDWWVRDRFSGQDLRIRSRQRTATAPRPPGGETDR